MIWQTIIVGFIVLSAISLTVARLIRFFSNPAHHCDGCTGCTLQELKQEIEAKKNS